MMTRSGGIHPLDRLRHGVAVYAGRGWPVVPAHYLAPVGRHRADGRHRVIGSDLCSCRDEGCDTPGGHPCDLQPSADPAVVGDWWSGPQPWNVGLATGDVLDVWRAPVEVAERALAALGCGGRTGSAAGPVAHTPAGDWLFVTAPAGRPVVGLPPGVLHHGPGDLVLAPPSRSAGGAYLRWWRPPSACPRLPDWEPVLQALLGAFPLSAAG